MARPRPPRDREAAPGEVPGAVSFARAGEEGSEPRGIVRLSELFVAQPATSEQDTCANPRRPASPPDDAAGDRVQAGRRSRRSPRDDGRPARRDEDSHPAPAVPAVDADEASDAAPAYEPLFGANPAKRARRPSRPPATATQRALALLTRREHSRKELTRKLMARGVDPEEVDAAVDRLAGAGWQDDRRFAESLVRARASAGYGPGYIRAELATHELPGDLAAAALESFDGDWHELARELAARRFARIPDARLRERKAADFLLRRGFPTELARTASRFDPADG